MNRSLGSVIRFAVGVAAEGFVLATCFPAEAATTVYELAQVTHFHGLGADPAETSRLYLATHDGLFVVEADGTANPLSDKRDDLTGFTPHPTKASILYASNHPAGAAISVSLRLATGARPGDSSAAAWAVRSTFTR